MLRLFVNLSRLVKLWAVVAAAGCFAFATPAAAQIDSRWGYLAELAEHDFEYGGLVITWRWKVPNTTITQTSWEWGGNQVTEYELDQATGTIAVRSFYRRRAGFQSDTITAEPDKLLNRKGQAFISKSDGGGYNWGSEAIRPITPGHKKQASVAKIIASGRLRAANPNLTSIKSVSQAASVAPMPIIPTLGPTFAPVTSSVGPRFALVIGNGEYSSGLGSLKNPPNDARLVAEQLRASGFQVELVLDADQRSMKQAISRLGERMASGGRGSTGLFYFAGHGMQSRGINYLIPTGAAIKREADVDLEAVSADTVLLQMEEADAGTNIIILDACRNTPVLRSFRSGTRGLAQMEAPNGSFISYSTAPGSVAADGAGDFSPFATALAQQLRNKGQPIEITFRNVRREVLKLTEGTQTPWDSSSLVETFMFNPG